jgi:hypothetical protein
MARRHPKECWFCGRTVAETGHISATGLCPTHSVQVEAENILSLQAKRGMPYRRWRARIAAAIDGLPIDAADESG